MLNNNLIKDNKSKGILSELKELARKTKRSNSQKVYAQYFLERFLYRLANSKYKNNFILRGSTLLYMLDFANARMTGDIDFMGSSISNDKENVIDVFKKISQIPCDDDRVVFYPDSIRIKDIMFEKTYRGRRIYIQAGIYDVKREIHFDLGYGDVITPEPKLRKYPIIFPDKMPAFSILTYTIETSLSEKIATIIEKGHINTRLKDFYDIWFIMNHIDYNEETLRKAMNNTFKQRNIPFTTDVAPFDISFYLIDQNIKIWNHFIISKNVPYKLTFYEVGLFITTTVKNLVESMK